MVPVYLFAIYGEWTRATTYTIIDVLAYCQLLTMGWPVGMGLSNRSGFGKLRSNAGNLAPRFASARRAEGHRAPAEKDHS